MRSRARPGERGDEDAKVDPLSFAPSARRLGARLGEAGRIVREEGDAPVYRTRGFVVPLGSPGGWEAAVFDHFHAVVRTIAAKVRLAAGSSSADDAIGGSTYGFEIWPGHPLESEVLGFLQRFRKAHSDLRDRVRSYNAGSPKPAVRRGVVIYGGQCHWELEDVGSERA